MEDYTFFDFENSRRGREISGFAMRVYNKRGNRRVQFSKNVGEVVTKRGLSKLRIRKDNMTGRIHLLFNRDKGVTIKNNGSNSPFSLRVNSVDMAAFLVKTFSLMDGDVLNLSDDLSQSDEYATFEVLTTKVKG